MKSCLARSLPRLVGRLIPLNTKRNGVDDIALQQPILPSNVSGPALTLMDIPTEELARQLSLIEFKLFVSIKYVGKKKKKKKQSRVIL